MSPFFQFAPMAVSPLFPPSAFPPPRCPGNPIEKLKSKEAKNVENILELLKTFRPLVDAYVATTTSPGTSAVATKMEVEVDGTDREGRATFSRLSVGLAVRQVMANACSPCAVWMRAVVLCKIVGWRSLDKVTPRPPRWLCLAVLPQHLQVSEFIHVSTALPDPLPPSTPWACLEL